MNELFFIGGLIALIAYLFLIETICKIEINKNPQADETDDPEKKDKNNDSGFIGFINSLTPLGLGVSTAFTAEYIYAISNGRIIAPKISLLYFVTDMIIFTLAQIIGFAIFFYIVYGVFSLVNSHGGNEQIRRNVAAWTGAVLDLILILATVKA